METQDSNLNESGRDSAQDRRVSKDFIEHVRALSRRAEESQETSKQLGLGIPEEEPASLKGAPDEAEAIKDTQNPDEAHRLFWAIQKTLMSALPKGREHKELRDYVYEEKGDYLNRGKLKDTSGIRGSDQRAGYLTHLRRALRVVRQWKREGGSAFDIWDEFRRMNEEAGYKPAREGPLKIQGTPDDMLRAAMRGKRKAEE